MSNTPDQAQREQDTQQEQSLVEAGLTYARITTEQLNTLMDTVVYKVLAVPDTTLTLAVALLPMGSRNFTLAIGEAACVDPRNFKPEIGAKFAIEDAASKARNRLWELEGYVLSVILQNEEIEKAVQLANSVESYDPNNTVNS
jgi:Phage protein (N4 Gp49/phage Sf6 gene 66) family